MPYLRYKKEGLYLHGHGDVDFKLLIKQFEKYDYNYDFTFQVSRARNHKHIERIQDSITFLKKLKFIN